MVLPLYKCRDVAQIQALSYDVIFTASTEGWRQEGERKKGDEERVREGEKERKREGMRLWQLW